MTTLTRTIAVLAMAWATSTAFATQSANASYRVGLGEQDPAVFDSPHWQSLGLDLSRYIVAWDWNTDGQAGEVTTFMNRARAAGQDVLVTFTAHRGCWNGQRYSRARVCRAPSRGAYRAAVRNFAAAFPWVRTYSAWNEINHVSQPTYKSPRRAATYYDVLRRECRNDRCDVVAADVLDTSNMRKYLRSFLRRARGKPRLWGLHNYQDVNRSTTADTRTMLRTVPGEVWLTETGGIVSFPTFPYSLSRAEKGTRQMFRLANRHDRRARGMRSRITRLYVYTWFGENPGARFDAGLVSPDGTPRPAYQTFKDLHKRSR